MIRVNIHVELMHRILTQIYSAKYTQMDNYEFSMTTWCTFITFQITIHLLIIFLTKQVSKPNYTNIILKVNEDHNLCNRWNFLIKSNHVGKFCS